MAKSIVKLWHDTYLFSLKLNQIKWVEVLNLLYLEYSNRNTTCITSLKLWFIIILQTHQKKLLCVATPWLRTTNLKTGIHSKLQQDFCYRKIFEALATHYLWFLYYLFFYLSEDTQNVIFCLCLKSYAFFPVTFTHIL